jgi:hypothetical protein
MDNVMMLGVLAKEKQLDLREENVDEEDTCWIRKQRKTTTCKMWDSDKFSI